MKIGRMGMRYIAMYFLLAGWLGVASAQSETILTFDEVLKNGSNAVDGLFGAEDIVITADSAFAYVAGLSDDDIAHFRRNKNTGQLTFIEVKADNVAGVDGLDGVAALALSPDQKFLYAAGSFDDAVAVFSRNAASGQLTFIEVKRDDLGGIDGLDGARDVTLSPDGNHVYVAGQTDDALVVFSRDAATGKLTLVEFLKDGVDNLNGIASVAVSPDGKHVYVASTFDDALVVFSRDSGTGALTFVEDLKNNVEVTNINGPTDVVVSADGNHVYLVSATSASLSAFTRNTTTGALTFVEVEIDNVDGVEGLSSASAVTVSADDKHIYVTGFNDDAVAVFSRNTTTGEVTYVEVEVDGQGNVNGLNGASGVIVTPGGENVYVTGSLDNAVAVFDRNSSTGNLVFVEDVLEGAGGVDGLGTTRKVAVSSNGQNIYTVDSTTDELAVFQRDSVIDKVRFIEIHEDNEGGVDGLSGARDLVLSNDDKFIYVVGEFDDGVAVFSREPTNGTLTFVEAKFNGLDGIEGLDGPISLVVSPDNQYLYIAANRGDAVVVFSRDTTTGRLTLVEFQREGSNGVNGINNATGIDITPDGRHVYVTGSIENSLVVFSRNTSDGTLSYIERYVNGVDGVDGLLFPEGLIVSPDGKHVYVAATSDDKISLFNRDSITGRLSFIEVVADNQGGVDGLSLVNALAISPDGQYLFSTGDLDDAIAVFARSTVTGQLSFIENHEDDQGITDGLNSPNGLAVTDDNSFVYVVNTASDGMAVFRINDVAPNPPFSFTATPGEDKVFLNWLRNADLDMSRYNIYRHTTTDSTAASVVLTVQHPDTTGTDSTAANNIQYFYWITAIDSANNEGRFSARQSARPADAPPTNPLILFANSGHRRVTLFWDPVNAADLSHYIIYRQTVSSFTPTRNDSIFSVFQPDTSHVDTTVVNGNTYYYRITAVDTIGNESTPSSEAIAFPTGPTDVTLSSFTTDERFGAVTFVWQVTEAQNHAGFHLLRGITPQGPFEKINEALILPEEGHQYRFKDRTIEANRTYTYQLQAVDNDGAVGVVRTVTLTVKPPATFELGQNFPNPFNPVTSISYALAEPSHVRITVYNLVGQAVRVLVDKDQPVGFHTIRWDGRNQRGQSVSSGIYLYQIEAGTFVDTRKMLLLK